MTNCRCASAPQGVWLWRSVTEGCLNCVATNKILTKCSSLTAPRALLIPAWGHLWGECVTKLSQPHKHLHLTLTWHLCCFEPCGRGCRFRQVWLRGKRARSLGHTLYFIQVTHSHSHVHNFTGRHLPVRELITHPRMAGLPTLLPNCSHTHTNHTCSREQHPSRIYLRKIKNLSGLTNVLLPWVLCSSLDL